MYRYIYSVLTEKLLIVIFFSLLHIKTTEDFLFSVGIQQNSEFILHICSQSLSLSMSLLSRGKFAVDLILSSSSCSSPIVGEHGCYLFIYLFWTLLRAVRIHLPNVALMAFHMRIVLGSDFSLLVI